jgi:hypothetical protein
MVKLYTIAFPAARWIAAGHDRIRIEGQREQ